MRLLTWFCSLLKYWFWLSNGLC